MDRESLIKLVKENLPSDVSLIKNPYSVRLSDDFLYNHGYIGYVFHIRYVFSDDSYLDEMLFVSRNKHKTFHNAISMFHKSIKELSERCYWVDESDIEKVGFKI